MPIQKYLKNTTEQAWKVALCQAAQAATMPAASSNVSTNASHPTQSANSSVGAQTVSNL